VSTIGGRLSDIYTRVSFRTSFFNNWSLKVWFSESGFLQNTDVANLSQKKVLYADCFFFLQGGRYKYWYCDHKLHHGGLSSVWLTDLRVVSLKWLTFWNIYQQANNYRLKSDYCIHYQLKLSPYSRKWQWSLLGEFIVIAFDHKFNARGAGHLSAKFKSTYVRTETFRF
jgi:hypothetical protein